MSYTRGTHIPLHLQIEAPDQETLELLAQPSAIHLQLKRRLYYKDNNDALFDEAVWTSSTDGYPGTGVRSFFGEIPLVAGLKTSYSSPTFSLNVSTSSRSLS